MLEEWAKEEWAKGKEDDLATLGSALRADAADVNRFWAPHQPLTGLSLTCAPARQVGGVHRVPRKDEVSPPGPSPMHSVTRGLQVDKDGSLYDSRSRMVVATCLAAATLVLDRASVQLCVVLVVAGGSWRCASLSATLRIHLRAQDKGESVNSRLEKMRRGRLNDGEYCRAPLASRP